MTAKKNEKNKRLRFADLNFVSQQSFDDILYGIAHITDPAIQSTIIPINEHTALFQMSYRREQRFTAEIHGRIHRWAGDMTHVYCDGRTMGSTWASMRYLGQRFIVLLIIAPFLLCPSAFVLNSLFLSILAAFSLFPFVIIGFYFFIRQILGAFDYAFKMEARTGNSGLEKPEKKDRERLLHALTHIIRDDDYAKRLSTESEAVGSPLTEEEIAALLEHGILGSR